MSRTLHIISGHQDSLGPVFMAWLDTLDSAKTRKAYRWSVERAFKTMDRTDPGKVTTEDVAAFKRSQANRAPATIALRLSALRSFFKFAVATGHVEADPTVHVKIPKAHAPAPRALSLRQAKRLVAQIDTTTVTGKRDAAAIGLLFGGLRASEVAGLNVADVTLESQDGHDFTRVKVLGKGAKPRDVDLPRRAYALIAHYLGVRPGPRDSAAPLFLARLTGFRSAPGRMSADRLYRQFRRYARKAKVKVSGSHAGRHTWTKLAEDGGAKMVDIMNHLGHANLNVTAAYLRRLSGKRNPAHSFVPEVV